MKGKGRKKEKIGGGVKVNTFCSCGVYSAASHASCLDGVLILRDFHKVLIRAGTGDFKV
jgi:hypothetical protein